MTKEDIKAIFKAGEALGFAKRAGQPTIGLTFDEQYEQLVKNCSTPDFSDQSEQLICPNCSNPHLYLKADNPKIKHCPSCSRTWAD